LASKEPKMMRRTLTAILFAFLFQLPAHAGDSYFYSGNVLARLVAEYQKALRKEKDTDLSDAWKFRAYVIGVHDTASGNLFCPPRDLAEIQTLSIVAKFIENHPEHWNKSGSDLVIMALSQSFPCAK
jgi:hypothetical protein